LNVFAIVVGIVAAIKEAAGCICVQLAQIAIQLGGLVKVVSCQAIKKAIALSLTFCSGGNGNLGCKDNQE
jgi:hypothetical protein